MTFTRLTTAGFSLVFLLGSVDAGAHIRLLSPVPRADADQKAGPCGGVPRSGTPTKLRAGETITISWLETVSHRSHFQIAFAADGEQSFRNPAGYEDIQATPSAGILADGLFPHEKGEKRAWEATVTLPDITCANCTIRLIQIMKDKPPYDPSFDGNDVYSACADIELSQAR